MEKVSSIRFAVIGTIVNLAFAILVEIFLWFRYVPGYDALFTQYYGVSLVPQARIIFLVALVVVAVISFILYLISAKVYNKLSNVRIK